MERSSELCGLIFVIASWSDLPIGDAAPTGAATAVVMQPFSFTTITTDRLPK